MSSVTGSYQPLSKPRPRSIDRADRKRAEETLYRKNSKIARERDGHRCRICGRHYGLETHHVQPRSLNRRSPSKHDVDRLLTVCAGPDSCHEGFRLKTLRVFPLTDRGTNGKVLVEKFDKDLDDWQVAMRSA